MFTNRLFILFFLIQGTFFAQLRPDLGDRVGNFRVSGYHLEWQKNYQVEDIETLNQKLKQDPFTEGIDILRNEGSTHVRGFSLSGSNLPEYAKQPYNAFVIIDVFYDRIRVTVKQIEFPDYKDQVYYNGMRVNTTRGTLEHYVLNRDKSIKRTTGALNVLNDFDTAFSDIFDHMLTPLPER
jgi:hypothetical protein